MIKEILFRASDRTDTEITLVANHTMKIPESRLVDFILVKAGFDVADNEIVTRLKPGDLVITADIPLAAEVIEKGGYALDPRGEMFSPDTIRSRLNMRDFMETLRSGGVVTGGPPVLGQSDRKAFAGELDKFLSRNR